MIKAPPIITCPQWGAKPARGKIVLAGRPNLIVEHHTAGHHPEIANPRDESRAEAIRYARDIQHFHQDTNGWIDSGHSFLVCRNGMILQGRWGTVTAIEHGRMVISAHCPGQNDQPGIEHEHNGDEVMTRLQWTQTVWLQAWIADRCAIRPTELYPHDRYYNTACPANLAESIRALRLDVASKLTAGGKPHRGTWSPLLRFTVNRTG